MLRLEHERQLERVGAEEDRADAVSGNDVLKLLLQRLNSTQRRK